MKRSRLKYSVTTLGVCLAFGFVLAAFGLGSASARHTAAKPAKVTTITVTAGKPSELAFKLSKTSLIPAGTVTFKIVNAGKIAHSFKICMKPSANANANSCQGKVTPILQPGKSSALTVTLTRVGTYEFLCTYPGHASAGMKGLIGLGVKVSPAAQTVAQQSSTTNTTTSTSASTTTVASPPPSNNGGGGNGGGGGAGTGPDGCPAGQTIVTLGANDHDEDDGGAASDGDGCI
jgi:uncharacterized cupredoxin-like copper-binding protein